MSHSWIDTDPGVDDALAILLAIAEVDSEIVGFSTVHGNVSESRAAANLARLIAVVRSNDLAPESWDPLVCRGSKDALVGPGRRADDYEGGAYHGRDGLGDASWELPGEWERDVAPNAAHSIVETARRAPGLRLVCLGPLTNVALALQIAPELPSLISGVVIMGGSFRVGGNDTMAAEFNFAADPEAAQAVLRGGFTDVTLVPIDVCDDVRMTLVERRELQAFSSPLANLANELLEGWTADTIGPLGNGLYDPVTWMLANHPSHAEWESAYVEVDTADGVARGASIADWRGRSGRQPNARIATRFPRRAEFFDWLFRLVA